MPRSGCTYHRTRQSHSNNLVRPLCYPSSMERQLARKRELPEPGCNMPIHFCWAHATRRSCSPITKRRPRIRRSETLSIVAELITPCSEYQTHASGEETRHDFQEQVVYWIRNHSSDKIPLILLQSLCHADTWSKK